MNKKASLIITFLITALIAGNYLFFADEGVVKERVEISRVIDGDTVKLVDGRTIRLLNINTPEKGLAYSELAKDYLSNFTYVELETEGLDRYQRTLGRLYYGDLYLNLEIVRQGMAHSYLVSDDEVNSFSKAEKYAMANEKNIWKKSEFYGCLIVEINKYEEYVNITDNCDLDFTDWTLKDESTKSYNFEQDTPSSFTLYSGKGQDTQDKLYWGKENIWNNDHDEIFIRDSNGLLVYYFSYG